MGGGVYLIMISYHISLTYYNCLSIYTLGALCVRHFLFLSLFDDNQYTYKYIQYI